MANHKEYLNYKVPPSLAADPRVKKGIHSKYSARDIVFITVYGGLRDTVTDKTKKEFVEAHPLASNHHQYAHLALIQDYVDKLRSEWKYDIISGQFLEALPVKMTKADMEKKFQTMVIKYFYSAAADTFRDDAVMMALLVTADLVNALLSIPDVKRGYDLVKLADKLLRRRSSNPTLNTQLLQWIEKYDHLVDPLREIEPVEDETLLEKTPSVFPPLPPMAFHPIEMATKCPRPKRASKIDLRIKKPDLPSVPETCYVVESFIASRLDKHNVVTKPKGFYSKSRKRYDHRRLGVAMEDYAELIESTGTYTSLLQIVAALLNTAENPRDTLLNILARNILPDFEVVFYDQIMTMVLLVSDIIVHDLQTNQTDRALKYYPNIIVNYLAKCSKKMHDLVEKGWSQLADIQDDLLTRDEFALTLLADPSIILGQSKAIIRTAQESKDMFNNQQTPLVTDPDLFFNPITTKPAETAGPWSDGQHSSGGVSAGSKRKAEDDASVACKSAPVAGVAVVPVSGDGLMVDTLPGVVVTAAGGTMVTVTTTPTTNILPLTTINIIYPSAGGTLGVNNEGEDSDNR